MSKILIGVDGGGSGCRAIVSDEALRVIGEAKGGSANVSSDFESAVANVRAVVLNAIGHSDVGAHVCIHMALAGVISEEIGARVAAAFDGWNVSVSDDRPSALAGALGGEDGYLAAIGTGSFLASYQGGEAVFVGGWGLAVSDQASGAWLGRRVLEETLLCFDGLRDPSGLTQAVMDKFGNDPNEIVAFSLAADPAQYGALAPLVVDHAERGDVLGDQLMDAGLRYILRGLLRLGWSAGERLCLTGGLGEAYAKRLEGAPAQGIIAPVQSTVMGALRLAQARAERG